MEEEVWKDVIEYEDYYLVSNLGNVKSKPRYVFDSFGREYIRKEKKSYPSESNGYLVVGLYKDGISKNKSIHRLVAKAFIPNPENKPQVNHIDGNKQNNCVSNLEWCTASENTKHGFDVLGRKAYFLWGEDPSKNPLRRGVVQLDLIGSEINRFISQSEAARKIGGTSTNISACCRGIAKTYMGCVWRFC